MLRLSRQAALTKRFSLFGALQFESDVGALSDVAVAAVAAAAAAAWEMVGVSIVMGVPP